MIVVIIIAQKMDKIKNILICIMALLITGCYFKVAEKERHEIPAGFIGEVIIFFDQEIGKIKEYDKDYRIYKIDNDGILVTQFEFNEGSVNDIIKDNLFFYNDSSKVMRPLTALYNGIDTPLLDSNDIVVFQTKTGVYGGASFQAYYIDTLKNVKTSKYQIANYSEEMARWYKIYKEKGIKPLNK